MANKIIDRVRAVPLRAVPRVAAHLLRRRWQAWAAPSQPRLLSEEDLRRALRPPLSTQQTSKVVAHFQSAPRPRLLRLPDQPPGEMRERLLTQAEAILAHRFDLLGSGPTDLGARINWRRDFKSGHEWPLAHFTRLTLVDLDAGYDIKVPWELSRFHHGVTLAQAYALTGQERFAAEFTAQVTAWLAGNPPEFGPNWANAMEVAIRAANWLAAYDLLAASPSLSPGFHLAFLTSLLCHGRYIAAHLESGWPSSNHYLADLCGLITLGALLPEMREAHGWLRTGLTRLAVELRRQVYADGGDYEASTGYHLLVTEMVLWAALVCRTANVALPPFIVSRLEAMLDVLAGLLKPDGTLPAFGDLDSGRWLTLESDREALPSGQDAQGVLALGAALYGRADWTTLAGDRMEAAAWVAASLNKQAASQSAQSSKPLGSKLFPDAGWCVMRSGDRYLALDAGNNGADGWGLHAHNDALSFELAVGERTFLVDPGSYAYTGDYRARILFRATASHNTLTVDGAEINRIPTRDMFRLENDAQVRVLRWDSDATHDLLMAEHDGYRRLGVIHRREVYFDKQAGGWLLRDRLLPAPENAHPAGQHQIDIYFHFAPLPLVVEGLAVRTACDTGSNLLLQPISGEGLVVSQQSGWVSPRYGVRLPAPVICYSARAALPAEFVFALWPLETGVPRDLETTIQLALTALAR